MTPSQKRALYQHAYYQTRVKPRRRGADRRAQSKRWYARHRDAIKLARNLGISMDEARKML